jgi:hypothetical protein
MPKILTTTIVGVLSAASLDEAGAGTLFPGLSPV